MKSNELTQIKTLGQLIKSGYQSKLVKDELRDNLLKKLENQEPIFNGILGYGETVIPAIERAILSRHNINFLGLRGQAKTRMARSMVYLLDEYIPVVEGSEINDDPLHPISKFAKDVIAEMGENTPIAWQHRKDRYTEKLATPDVSIADLIGDTDPIKAANMKIAYSDEKVIHFGMVPRANRGIFVINELPDLQPRIQVALFNILQEGDIQIRGFKLRLNLDIQFVFTANPEDYTNRGSIITPLKDRIQSQIITHYPKSIATSKEITLQESRILPDQQKRVSVDDLIIDLIEQIAFEARKSEFIDQKSGVSARLTISAYESLISTAERRAIINQEKYTQARIGDLLGIIPAITGKVELVYEGEQEGSNNVAHHLLGKSIRTKFATIFPDPELVKKRKNEINPYDKIVKWFNKNEVNILSDLDDENYKVELEKVAGLKELAKKYAPKSSEQEQLLLMEFILHGLAEFSMLSKNILESGLSFTDLFNSVFSMNDMEEGEEN
jgi:magnesium chelatase subunit I